MKELECKPCGNGLLFKAFFDPSDNTVMIYDRFGHMAYGYFSLEQLEEQHDSD